MKRREFAMGLVTAAALAPALGRAAIATDAEPQRGNLVGAERAWELALNGASAGIGRSDALLILVKGQPVFEKYGEGHGPDVRHISWSMAKSITHALVGIGVAQGRVDIDQPLKTVINPDPKLTLRSLLTLTDGLDWDEGTYSPTDSDATKMLFGPGRFDGAAYTGAKRQAHPPGTRWNYSTGAFQLAAAELQRNLFPNATTPEQKRATMSAWMARHLFAPLGMRTALAEFDASGTFYGGSLVYASAHDFARFGELYRQDGVSSGHRLLPKGWVKFARTPTVEPTYGAGFWLETKPGSTPMSLLNGAGPMDTFAAEGHAGQVIAIIPSKAAVVVRLGLMDDDDKAWKALGSWLTPVINGLADA